MLLLYILWDDWPNFMISRSNEQLQQQLEYTLLKPDCHYWWISKMQSDTLEERYAIKFWKAGSLWEMMRGVGGVRKSIHQSLLAKGLELGLEFLCWGFKGDSVRTGQHSWNWVCNISTWTLHQSTTASLSQTIWPR